MKFTRVTPQELEQAQQQFACAEKQGREDSPSPSDWEAYYVVKTRSDMTMSVPDFDESFGIYFQPRIGTGRGVIALHEALEVYRVDHDG